MKYKPFVIIAVLLAIAAGIVLAHRVIVNPASLGLGTGAGNNNGTSTGSNNGTGGGSGGASTSTPATSTTGLVPLVDMKPSDRYLGQFQGGLYEGGLNTPPADHNAAGLAAMAKVQPLDVNGNPGASGKVVMLSIGMSNWTMEFCSGKATEPCDPYSFMGEAASSSAVNHSTLVIKNGALGGRVAETWICPTGACIAKDPQNEYDRVRDTVLTPAGLSEKQVQIVVIEDADPKPTASLPSSNADAYQYEKYLGDIVRAAKQRYPNVQEFFISTRTSSQYATSNLNPEPYAYEYGYAVKWFIDAQIKQMRGTAPDLIAGDLSYKTGMAPWVTWGPYYWANGKVPCANCEIPGLTWAPEDFIAADHTHPTPSGRQKVADALMHFFLHSSYSAWFRAQ